jgi:hypothetical protein
MAFFIIKDLDKVELSGEILALPPFTRLWESSEDKRFVKKLFAIIYHQLHPNSAYHALEPKERLKQITKHVLEVDSFEFSEEFQAALAYYETTLDSFEMRTYNAARHMMDEINAMMMSIDRNATFDPETANSGMFDAADGLKQLKDLGPAMKNIRELKKIAMESMKEEGSIRGGGKIGLFEK